MSNPYETAYKRNCEELKKHLKEEIEKSVNDLYDSLKVALPPKKEYVNLLRLDGELLLSTTYSDKITAVNDGNKYELTHSAEYIKTIEVEL